jgi:uncharacterized protein YfaS (alpha-2-macroglobulin family)
MFFFEKKNQKTFAPEPEGFQRPYPRDKSFLPRFFSKKRVLACLLLLLFSGPSLAQDVVHQPAGTLIVPDQFLRRWDPVTLFFPQNMGAEAGAPDDTPGKLVTMSPAQPGAWTWLDGRTLQFRPATPWPPLSQFTFTLQGRQPIQLSRLLDPTLSTDPANGTVGLEKMSSLTLVFSEPLDVRALARMLDIAISPLPGLDPAQAQHLTPHDFDIKTMERTAPGDNATYIIEFHQPIPDGMAVNVSIGLSPVPGLAGTVEQLSFQTAEAFRPTLMGCANARVPLSAAGTVYDQNSALSCASDDSQDNSGADQQDQSAQAPSGPDLTAPNDAPMAQLPVTTPKQPTTGSADQAPAPVPGQPAAPRQVVVEFSANPGAIDAITARNFIRITPAVENVQTQVNNNEIDLTADFHTGTLYQITLNPVPLTDVNGRALTMTGPSSVWVYWPPAQDYLTLSAGNGVAERYGPQMIPLSGRGYTQADLRIHEIDPLDRSFWPFPATPVTTNDDDRPPAPGEQTAPWTQTGNIDPGTLQSEIAQLGSPSISRLAALPLTPLGPSASFGLDLKGDFARISGRNNPGTYLIGLRALDQPGTRSWMRVQVTDLSVTPIEEPGAVRFVVTSLSTGLPVPGAHIAVDAVQQGAWTSIGAGATDADGAFNWQVAPAAGTSGPTRIVVTKDDDTLVVDPTQPPDQYTANGWSPGASNWLAWTAQTDLTPRYPQPATLCHIFTERPIYRPEDPVHIRAFIRQLQYGLLTPDGLTEHVQLTITGPDSADSWQYDVTPDANGDLHYFFNQPTTATGPYTAEIDINGTACATVSFIKDAYRLPKFQITMNGPDEIPLDKSSSVGMVATYYAGGPAAGQPVRWRVTEFPYGFAPAARPGFLYATDSMFQPDFSQQSTASNESQATTDKEGRASLTLDPTQEPSNAPRRYVVEATVTGDDGQTVTNTRDVLALPSFVLALKAPRYLPSANAIPVQVLMVDAGGKPIAGRPITLTLLRRQWSSILLASDFSDGKAKYQTEVVDEKRIQRTLISGPDAIKLNLPIDKAGVYIVQLQAADDLGRLQTVSLDLFAAGANPVSWSRPPSNTFQVTTDKPAYVPGDVAKLILQSPFQTARALAIVELPNGVNQYQWVNVANGYGVFSLPINKSFMPRIPVHFVLMRGRLPSDEATQGLLDLRRPETIAATAWVGVTPVKNIVTTTVTAPTEALPGSTIKVTVKLADDQGKPISGEVTLWLINQAVLALAPEAPLDPLPDFIRDRGSRVALSDTRNWPFGVLPLDEDPGGEAADTAAPAPEALLNRVTIRKNFNPMPYYNPGLKIGPSGTATVTIKLPDDLTVFKIRAISVSGPERFGFAVGQIAVRLPVIVEPNLPRFVRPGDSFSLAGIGRIVSGPGGAGQAQLAVQGLTVSGPLTSTFTWAPNTPQPFAFPVTVPSPGYTQTGALSRTSVKVTVGVERNSDQASDAFSVDLPIQPDRDPVHVRLLTALTSAKPLTLPAIPDPARPGTVRRQLLVSNVPELTRLYAGLDYLRDYPFGCTEQRIALARSELAAQEFSAALDGGDTDRTTRDVNQTLQWITSATDPNGLAAFWPGDPGDVTLTAWAVEFMVEAQKAGFTIDPVEYASLTHALTQSLRSDYPNFVSEGAYIERAWALAALADAGQLDRDYADELARQQNQLSLEGIAQVAIALQNGGAGDDAMLKPLRDALFTGLIIKLRDGKQIYGGLQQGFASTDYPEIFPSETRTLSEMLRATTAENDPRRKLMVDALVTLGGGDGWGSTNANAEAMLALTAYLKSHTGAPAQSVAVALGTAVQKLALSGTQPLQRVIFTDGGAVSVAATGASTANPLSVQDDLTWLPAADGSTVAPVTNGFVVTSESDLVDLTGGPMTRTRLDHPGMVLNYTSGQVIEDHIQVVNPVDRNYVAITVPLAAGMEPLDPALATAPPEAAPSAPPTLAPSYVAFLDDRVSYYYDSLPAGTYDFYFRTKANIPGRFIQPAAQAVMMYDDSVSGGGAGAVVTISASK